MKMEWKYWMGKVARQSTLIHIRATQNAVDVAFGPNVLVMTTDRKI